MDLSAEMLEEFAVSRRIVQDGSEVMPRFRIFAPDGEHVAFVQMRESIEDRLSKFNTMRLFMIWKAGTGFIMASETIEPKALFVACVSRKENLIAVQMIHRDGPVSFGAVQWYPPDLIDDAILKLLPPKPRDRASARRRWRGQLG
jgi:hypothetical protein